MVLSSSPPLQNHSKTLKFSCSKPTHIASDSIFIPTLTNSASTKLNHLQTLTKTQLSFTVIDLFTSLPSLASETAVSSTETASGKIDLESILLAIDDFFNRYPFFVATCTFIWLVVIPLTQEYLSKCKFISAIDAFQKLRNDPNAQLLDIRNKKTMVSLGSPNLKSLKKSVVEVEFVEGDENGFLNNVLSNFADPINTVVCILDNFDGNSLKAAELLYKNGFKEAYAISGGVRGKKGWLAIQETLLPPAVHILPKKKKKKTKTSQQVGINGIDQQAGDSEASSSGNVPIANSPVADDV
ncbi:Rhodanese domain-containing protein [Citrus sinensis]|uniref:Rhodanese domain-containing protein n=1 Tax=Citrus sinensis TaxID=2711 RepID=A0ACB8N875_CITSI|nr:Rhodanese domain-containing protein [Citrus sinensis]